MWRFVLSPFAKSPARRAKCLVAVRDPRLQRTADVADVVAVVAVAASGQPASVPDAVAAEPDVDFVVVAAEVEAVVVAAVVAAVASVASLEVSALKKTPPSSSSLEAWPSSEAFASTADFPLLQLSSASGVHRP